MDKIKYYATRDLAEASFLIALTLSRKNDPEFNREIMLN